MVTEENILTVANGAVEQEAIVVEGNFPNLPKDERKQNPVTPPPAHIPGKGQNDKKKEELPSEIPPERRWMESQKAEDFPAFLMSEVRRIPQPNACGGNRSAIERSLGQHKRLNNYISKALQSDYDSKLDAGGIDKLRQRIEHGIEQLEHMIHSLEEMKKQRRKMRRRGEDEQNDLTKEAGAQKVPYFATAFQRAIAGAIVNGKISGGRNLDELYNKAKEKYGLDKREELAIFQLLADMGYPTFKDRLRIGEENQDSRDGLGEWQKQYYA